jgi:ribose 5-phosphate isomerase B
LNYDVIDVGTDKKVSCHYPDFAEKMSKIIKTEDRGILICGSGIGIAMAANKAGLNCSTAYN